MKRPRKLLVKDVSGQAYTIVVHRGSVHAMGSNGWDSILWLGSWILRLLRRDRRWCVSLREGRPELCSGTQRLMRQECFYSWIEASDFAGKLQAESVLESWTHDERSDEPCE